ncbi:hypothetical protein L1987_54358 [Smallanthus sonchifolius]|uniref:Uncharacterized protein n=1 Tax=Smallanthus sonchifolius TaxID=185202 RepID=A0ACB9E803_9ASTR|nr:hypothetical protein L1987_54358 [Smallanthus sonchifolius]
MIECEGKEDIVIFEPMELLKFQPEDLEVLFQNHIQAYSDEDETNAKAYQQRIPPSAKLRRDCLKSHRENVVEIDYPFLHDMSSRFPHSERAETLVCMFLTSLTTPRLQQRLSPRARLNTTPHQHLHRLVASRIAVTISTGTIIMEARRNLWPLRLRNTVPPTPSPQQAPIPTPPPSPQQIYIPTPPTSPSHEPISSVPRVKTLSLELKNLQDHVKEKEKVIEGLRIELNECKEEKLISKKQEEFKTLAEIVEQLKASLVKPVQQQTTTSTAQGETTSEVKVDEQEFDLPSASQRREARKRGKGTIDEVETVILDEEDVASDDELNAHLDEIDNFGYNDLHPEILPTKERETEKTRYFTEEGDKIQALSDEEKVEEDVQVNCDFKGMKPRNTKKKISKTRFHPKTKKPYVFLSAVIEFEGKEDIVILEPMELLKFQAEDLEVLFQNHIQAYSDEYEADAKAYQRVMYLHVKPYIPRTTEGPTT